MQDPESIHPRLIPEEERLLPADIGNWQYCSEESNPRWIRFGENGGGDQFHQLIKCRGLNDESVFGRADVQFFLPGAEGDSRDEELLGLLGTVNGSEKVIVAQSAAIWFRQSGISGAQLVREARAVNAGCNSAQDAFHALALGSVNLQVIVRKENGKNSNGFSLRGENGEAKWNLLVMYERLVERPPHKEHLCLFRSNGSIKAIQLPPERYISQSHYGYLESVRRLMDELRNEPGEADPGIADSLQSLIQTQIGIPFGLSLPQDAVTLVSTAQEWIAKPLERAQSNQ